MTFGERLKVLRTEKGLSQRELSERLKLNRATYARYETGDNQPDYDTLQMLADFFGVSTDHLLGHSIEAQTTPTADPSISPEEREFLKWVKEQVSDSFFYDWDKDPDERKSDYIKGLRLIYELEKDRKPGQKQGE